MIIYQPRHDPDGSMRREAEHLMVQTLIRHAELAPDPELWIGAMNLLMEFIYADNASVKGRWVRRTSPES